MIENSQMAMRKPKGSEPPPGEEGVGEFSVQEDLRQAREGWRALTQANKEAALFAPPAGRFFGAGPNGFGEIPQGFGPFRPSR
jgi:hypothetical protein